MTGFSLNPLNLFRRSAHPASAPTRPPYGADLETAFAFYCKVSLEETKAMAKDGLGDATVFVTQPEPDGAPAHFMIYVEGPKYSIRYTLNFKERRLQISNLTNNAHDRKTGRRLVGLAFALACAQEMETAGVNAGNTTGAYFWACCGMYARHFDMDHVRMALAPRVDMLEKYQDRFDYAALQEFALLKEPSSLTRLALMRDEFPFDAADFDYLGRQQEGYRVEDYLKCGIIRETGKDEQAQLMITPAKFVLLGKSYYGEADLTDPTQAAIMTLYTGVSQKIILPQKAKAIILPKRRAGYLSTPAGQTARPR